MSSNCSIIKINTNLKQKKKKKKTQITFWPPVNHHVLEFKKRQQNIFQLKQTISQTTFLSDINFKQVSEIKLKTGV